MPPAEWISSKARSKPCFHCAPYCAFGPVRGPLTPSMIGSEDSAKAAREVPAVTAAASDALTSVRRLILLMLGSICSPIEDSSASRTCQRSLGGRRRLAERQHQSVRPVEERSAVDHVNDFGVIESGVTQLVDVLFAERDRRGGQRDRRFDHGIPASAEIGANALVKQ